MPEVTVVVPMYNVQEYIRQCVDSIINQTLKDIEIILVDDESPDDCGKIAEEYAQKDGRIKVIHQKNKWLGGARNAGIKIAKGEYIACVDADDYIAQDFCEKLYNYGKENNCDIVFFDMNIVTNGEIKAVTSKQTDIFEENNVVCGDSIKKKIYPLIISSHDFNINVTFFSRKLVEKGFLFDEDIRFAEDYEAALRIYKIANSVGYLKDAVYYYRQNENSIMHVIKPIRLYQHIDLFVLREKFITENNLGTQENLYNSAHLLIKLLIEKFPFVFGVKGKSTRESVRELKELFKNEDLNTAVGRLSFKTLNMGIFGKLCLTALKLKMPLTIILLSKKYNNK